MQGNGKLTYLYCINLKHWKIYNVSRKKENKVEVELSMDEPTNGRTDKVNYRNNFLKVPKKSLCI